MNAYRIREDMRDQILLTASAQQGWEKIVFLMENLAPQLGLGLEEIPTEKAEILPDGSARLYMEIPSMKPVELVVPPEQWTWTATALN